MVIADVVSGGWMLVGEEVRVGDESVSMSVNFPREPEVPPAIMAAALQAELDRMRRLWNRLEAAVSHHKKAMDGADLMPWDEALYAARDKILSDYAEGKG